MPIFEKKEDIFELLEKFEKSSATEITIADSEKKISIKKGNAFNTQLLPNLTPLSLRSEIYGLGHNNTPQVTSEAKTDIISQKSRSNIGNINNINEDKSGKIVKAPLIGVYYSAPSPDSEPFIEVGKKINKGSVVCIIEAMKVMNEIESEIDGEVVEIFVNNAQPVEFGQPLFRVK